MCDRFLLVVDCDRISEEDNRMDEEPCETEYPKDFTSNLKLHSAARKGNIRKLRRLCKSGINPDAVNEQCQSPLFIAALHSKEKAVQLLLASGADPNHPCHDGSTPMHAACLSCSPSILCYLANAGGNINHHDNRGLLPRDWISYQEDMDKRFKMRKFLEAMRLYAMGTLGDDTLNRQTRSRWNALMDNIRQFPARRGRQWRRRRWFTASPRRRFRPRVPANVLNFFQQVQNIDWVSVTSCFRFRGREEPDVTQVDTLRSKDIMKPQKNTEQSEKEACKLQLSDSTYPILTLYVDEKEGKLTSTKRKEDVRHLGLGEIEEEERSLLEPDGGSERKEEEVLACSLEDGVKFESRGLQDDAVEGAEDLSGTERKIHFRPYQVLSTKSEACEDVEKADADGIHVDRSSTSSDDSCKNRMMEILEDAFRLELAPKVSDLMADYCDSTQGSTAAQESLDIDFHSFHGDDPEDRVGADPVEWIGEGSRGENCNDNELPYPQEMVTKCTDDDRNRFDAAEPEIDDLLLKDAGDDDEDEDDRNFIKEGRYVDVQKMLTANLETVFPETIVPVSPCDLNNNAEINEHQQKGDEEGNLTAGSSLYQVSTLNEAAFISDLSLEVNVDESLKSSLESVPQPQENDDDSDDRERNEEEEEDMLENAPLHSALAKMDLTQAEKEEVQEWFGGHGSVRNLILNYESMIKEIQCDTLRSNVTSLSALLRREYGMTDQDNTSNTRRCVSDTAALCQNQKATKSLTTRSECPRVMPSADVESAPPLGIPDEMEPDDSWLWPASGEEDSTFEEKLRRSMEVIGLDDDDDGSSDGEKGEIGRGDADYKKIADLRKLVSPPPPACTPEEHSPHPTPENQADSSTLSHVNNSGDCDTPEADHSTAEPFKESTLPPASSPSLSARAVGAATPMFSPPGCASGGTCNKKLVQIDVMRSPTVEAIQNTSN